tara:strand:- start:95 stop:283 length:189 start_codon:yes stop_codon:yes gene_type:complete
MTDTEENQEHIQALETNLYNLLRHLQQVKDDRKNGWQAEVCLHETNLYLGKALEAYQEIYDR